jgi:hypothetical protein
MFKGKLFVLIMCFLTIEIFWAANAALIFFLLISASPALFPKVFFSMCYKNICPFSKTITINFLVSKSNMAKA